jgi:hypothetical protein
MPYVPSEKTDGKSQDRNEIDVAVEALATDILHAEDQSNFGLAKAYVSSFLDIGDYIIAAVRGQELPNVTSSATNLAFVIMTVGARYKYEGAFLGELNYAITRLIQRVPQLKVEVKVWEEKSELRYWLYAVTVEALTFVAARFMSSGIGIGGVFEDIKDEYKRRVNVGYEAAQIIKSGDCYDTPYYTRLVEVVSDQGEHIGYQEVMLKRSDETLKKDVLDAQIVLRTPIVSNK